MTAQTAPQPDGTFEFINVAPGDYVLQTSAPGPFANRFVSVSDADVTSLTLRTAIGSTARGHITLEGAPARVRPQDLRFNFVSTDLDLGPAPGTYRAKIIDDWNFRVHRPVGPLLIRPFAGPDWLVKTPDARATGPSACAGFRPPSDFVAAVDRLEGSDTSGEWEDPAVLESLLPYTSRVSLSDGQATSTSLRLIGR